MHKASGPDRPRLVAFRAVEPMCGCAARLQICLWQMLALQASRCPQRCSLVSFWSALTSLVRYELRPRTDTALARGGLTARLQLCGFGPALCAFTSALPI